MFGGRSPLSSRKKGLDIAVRSRKEFNYKGELKVGLSRNGVMRKEKKKKKKSNTHRHTDTQTRTHARTHTHTHTHARTHSLTNARTLSSFLLFVFN